MYKVVDYQTRKLVKHDNFVYSGQGRPLEVVIDLQEVKSRIYQETFIQTPLSVSKYLPFFPLKDYKNFVTLQEGATPLVPSKNLGRRLGCDLYFKVESKNPTGSFKDRGTAVEMSVAKELGAKGISVASTGNMAASCSCYAAASGIPCFVFVPEDTPPSKLAQVISYGGRIVQIKGNYNDAVVVAEDVAKHLNFYLAGDYCFRVEGAKTAAFEIAEQFDLVSPDAVFIPMGVGTNLSAYYKGFCEYLELGFIERLPSIYGIQAAGASAIVDSFEAGRDEIIPVSRVSTMASAIAVRDPLDGIKALDAIRNTGGKADAVTDSEMLEAQYLIAKEEGLFTEMSGAGTVATLMKLTQRGELQGKRVVCVLVGDGLKDPRSVLKVAVKPPIIKPDVESFLRLYDNKFFEGKTVVFVDSDITVFDETPSAQRLAVYLWDKFNVSFQDDYLEQMRIMIEQFLKKGKEITFSDLQDIVQDALESVKGLPEQALVVKNFEVQVAMDKQAHATVWIELDNKELTASSTGVGPVDALIQALKKACPDGVPFELTSYNVDIRSQGVDAVVYVDLKLVSNGDISLGKGASPDIIQASLHAFEKAYNGLLG